MQLNFLPPSTTQQNFNSRVYYRFKIFLIHSWLDYFSSITTSYLEFYFCLRPSVVVICLLFIYFLTHILDSKMTTFHPSTLMGDHTYDLYLFFLLRERTASLSCRFYLVYWIFLICFFFCWLWILISHSLVAVHIFLGGVRGSIVLTNWVKLMVHIARHILIFLFLFFLIKEKVGLCSKSSIKLRLIFIRI